MPTGFTPCSALAGGALIGLAVTLLYATLGRITGFGGILDHALEHRRGRGWRIALLLSLVAGAGLWFLLGADVPAPRRDFSIAWLVASGLLVGFGTRLGGSTSRQSVAGSTLWSKRSCAAVAVSMVAAAVTLSLLRHVLGGVG